MLGQQFFPEINNFHNNNNRGNLRFVNNKLQSLYDRVYSQEVAALNTTDDIYNTLHELIEAVVSDPRAMDEAKTWNEFRTVLDHQNGRQEFLQMNFYVSRAFSLWMYVYH